MRALLRNYKGEVYVWKDVTYKDGRFYVNGADIFDTEIVALEDDNRNEYIQCSACGKIFRKGSTEWEEHIEPIVDTHKCFECRFLRPESNSILDIQYTLQENGTYNAIQKSNVKLKCGRAYENWKYADINSVTARRKCEYNKCTTATPKEITDIFTEHPDVFDDIITVDKIIEAGYRERNVYGGETEYLLKGKNLIYAVVNSLNIVDCFKVRFRNHDWTVCYSSKHNKFYSKEYKYINGLGRYVYDVWRPHISVSTEEYIKKKIAALYL